VAVGAQAKDILAMIFRESLVLTGAGAAAGIALAYGAAHLLESLLAGVPPGDLKSYAAGLSIVFVTSLGGSFWPAIRALRVDPMTAMRAE